jgi:hypothetical protein
MPSRSEEVLNTMLLAGKAASSTGLLWGIAQVPKESGANQKFG